MYAKNPKDLTIEIEEDEETKNMKLLINQVETLNNQVSDLREKQKELEDNLEYQKDDNFQKSELINSL